MEIKYAVKVMIFEDDWIYLTEPDGSMFEVRPVLFNSRQEAEEHASIWGVSKVVRYPEW